MKNEYSRKLINKECHPERSEGSYVSKSFENVEERFFANAQNDSNGAAFEFPRVLRIGMEVSMIMEMNYQGLQDKDAWREAGIRLPEFDWQAMCEATEKKPVWVHFGAGNIFRGFIAVLQQRLLNAQLSTSGIVAVDNSSELIDKIYLPYDNMTLLAGLKPDGQIENEVIASVSQAIRLDASDVKEWEKLAAIFRNPALQIVSFTITEKGYALTDVQGNMLPAAADDIKNGPDAPYHGMSMLTALMLRRFKAKALPLALASMDNCSHNGDILKKSVLTIARGWRKNGYVDEGFIDYLSDEKQVSFPLSMIDKITPRPADEIYRKLSDLGVEKMDLIKTSGNYHIAPFVNAEIPEYLVLEERFPNGRPPLEKAGVYLTNRETVNMSERMKVTTCLNPLHTALAVFGCLLGYESIADEMRDRELRALVELIGYKEGMPVVTDPGIFNPEDFIREVIEERLPNPYIPDTPQRIATDTSQKIAIRFGETIKAYVSRPDLDISGLNGIPLVLAGWLRYLLAVDDEGKDMPVSSDPMLENLSKRLSGITYDNPSSCREQLKPILSNTIIFGVDLYKAGIGDKTEEIFRMLLEGPGAVRRTLRSYTYSILNFEGSL